MVRVQALLAQIIKYPTADLAVLQKVIEVMSEPTDLLLQAFLANDLFQSNVSLVEQLLTKLQGRAPQWVIAQLSAIIELPSEMLTVIIKQSSGSVGNLSQIIDTHASRLSVEQLLAIVRALPEKGSEKPSEKLIFLLQRIMAHDHAETAVLEAAICYTLHYGSQLIEAFWRDISRYRWHQLSNTTICNLFLNLPEQHIDEFFRSQSYKDHRESVINKLLLSANPTIFAMLLNSRYGELESRHLLLLLKMPNQELLPKVVMHRAADFGVLKKIIEVMKEPTESLVQALFAQDCFQKDVQLVRQLLSRVQGAARKNVVVRLSAMGNLKAEMLDILIEEMSGDVTGFIQLIATQSSRLNASHLCLMVQILSRKRDEPKLSEIPILLQKMMVHAQVDLVVLETVVNYALSFDSRLLDTFWRDLSLLNWEKLDHKTISRMFLNVTYEGRQALFQSRGFTADPNSVINKLLLFADPKLLDILLKSQHVKLESRHLLMVLKEWDAVNVQAILPQIAKPPAANLAVLQNMIEVMSAPVGTLLPGLLANNHFITNASLVRKFLGRVQSEEREHVISQLNSIANPPPDVLAIMIEENQFNDNGLKDILRRHPNLSSEQLIAMIPRDLPKAKMVWHGLEVSNLLLLILRHGGCDASVLKIIARCALDLVQPDSGFWQQISEKLPKLDLSSNNLGRKSEDELKQIFSALGRTVELDLSGNGLESGKLANCLKTLSSSVRRLDISGNNLDRKTMPKIIASIPLQVSQIAYEGHEFIPRAEVIARFTDYSFMLNCLAGVATVTGAALVVFGVLYLQPIFVTAGTGMMSAVVIGETLSACGLFSTKKSRKMEKPGFERQPFSCQEFPHRLD